MVLFQLPTGDVWDKLLLLLVLGAIALAVLRDLRTLQRVIAQWRTDRKAMRRPTPSGVSQSGGNARTYTYRGAARAGVMLTEASGVASILICALSPIALIVLALRSSFYPILDLIRCLLICDLAAGWFIGAGLINAFPTVWVGEEGIAISVYFTRRVMIPWADLVDVKRWPALPGSYLVRATRITPMHQLYGWLARTRLPSFIIHQSIDGRDELFHELGQRVPTTH